MSEKTELATFAGGCFWCMVGPFEQEEGVHTIISGYTGGHTENPTYQEVCSDTTGHVEAVQIEFDPDKVTYDKLLEIFWRQIDPTDAGGQFNDRGESYGTAIFYHNESQQEQAEASKEKMQNEGPFKGRIVTPVRPAKTFYRAEEGHQEYHKKNSYHYNMYKRGSGRAGFIETHWGNA
ncbi:MULTISPECIES: peptide-methionine (S)-S-oxide reductase MsrA [Sinobaca]|uniref:Peptide methionine sulfoxide reductase MsrA n=1 Tax=Sinobaca qinghaiensis TaxID=342944 RepID=A0A419UZF7_9BACL|nr:MULTISPECIES: peptide-methionine (S)-S-oxide reductase MsrA [Sinobaca]RKD71075.1 peptide-methionine (S)-S-oxide reductase/peptide methionine sulfoxide reductase msrA/msrB [Sinobaca qinghaiensis]